MKCDVELHEDPKRDGKYNVHHFVNNDEVMLAGDYGILGFEEMHADVKQAFTDLKEGDATADPEGVADKWRDRARRGLKVLDALEEYLVVLKIPPHDISKEIAAWNKVVAIVEEQVDDE